MKRNKLYMIKPIKIFFLLSLFVCSVSYSQITSSVSFVESDQIIFNPERGFYSYTQGPLSSSYVSSLKAKKVSVVQRNYVIPQYNDKPLPESFLTMMENDFSVAREGGVKVNIRFFYTDAQGGKDAALDTVLLHISQIKPILQNNFDVIVYMDAGFIGAWGEWYYSTHGLNNTADRRTVLFALLDAMPVERSIVIRTPNYKRQIFDNNEPLTVNEAFSGINRARTGAHNDCFLANATDFGTYLAGDIEGDKTYLNLDNRFVPQSGETCCDCGWSGCTNALEDLNRMHWSVLNEDYHPDVLTRWENEGCMDEIKKRLGYRFVLKDGKISSSVKPGGEFTLNLNLVNKGFASPYNPRNLELILRDNTNKIQYRVVTTEDPRYWLSGDSVNIEISAGIMDTMPEGNYELLMHLADPQKALHNRSAYSIRLANENLWEDSTGFNSLNHFVQIDKNASGSDYSGSLFFNPDSIIIIVDPTSDIIIDGVFDDWSSVPVFDVSPDEESEGDGINPNVDIKDIWVTDDIDNVYISYSLAGDFEANYFYHVLFDTDRNKSSGFHMNNSFAGIDLMIENENFWEYTGTDGGWGWNSLGGVGSSVGVNETNRIEMAISKSMLNQLGTSSSVDLIFDISNLDDNQENDYAPNAYKERSYTYNYKITSVEETTEIPEEYYLKAYPNPFNGEINLVFNINQSKIKSAGIYDILGRLVKSYSKDELSKNSFSWNAKNSENKMMGSGIYFFVLNTNEKVLSTKLVLIK